MRLRSLIGGLLLALLSLTAVAQPGPNNSPVGYPSSPTGPAGIAARTNLLLQSGNLANATNWTLFNQNASAPVVTANAATAPDGTTTAAQIVLPAVAAGSAQASCIIQLASSLTASSAYTYSVWLKGAVGGEQTYISFQENPSWYVQRVTLTTSWQRFSLTATVSGTAYFMGVGSDMRAASPETATLAETIYAWGGQLQTGAYATILLPTTTVAVTRPGDWR